MRTESLKEAIETGVRAALQNLEAARVKNFVDEAIEDGLVASRRVVKRSRRQAEEAIDATTYTIKRHPLAAVGITFGVGIGIGAAIGLLASRNGHCRS